MLLTPPLLAQAPNMVPVCVQSCTIDSNSNSAALYQYGDPNAGVWGNTFSAAYPLLVNYTNAPLLGIPPNWTGPMPTTLYVQQTASVQTIKAHNADPANWTLTIPALVAPTGTVTASVVSGTTSTTSANATVTTADKTITTTAPVIPAGTTLCTVPKNGGACKTPVAISLATLTANVPGQTISVTSVPTTYLFSCTAPSDTSGNVVLSNLNCTAVKQ